MRIAIAVLMVLHGIAHLPGFLVPWGLVASSEPLYRTTVLGGVDLGPSGIRGLGVLWLVAGLAFCAAAAGAVGNRAGWTGLALGVAAASLLLCLTAWPAARAGVPVNIVIAAGVIVAPRLGWL